MDVTDIPMGVDFQLQIKETIRRSEVLLVIIGARWVEPGKDGFSRISNDNDPIRVELATALSKGISIIPVLVDGARMPSANELPEDIRDFAYLNAAMIDSGRDFAVHVERLLRAIDDRLREPRRPWHISQSIGRLRDALMGDKPKVANDIVRPKQEVKSRELDKRSVEPPTKPKPPTPQPVSPPNPYQRTTPEYWLQRVAVQRKLPAGDEPLVMISYASEDHDWVSELRAFLDRRIEQLNDPDGRSYELWNFADLKRGTTLGDEFPEIVAEKMWRCRLAIVVLSKDYFSSAYCRTIELPFLMWRRGHHGLMCFPVKLGAVPIDMVRVPGYERPSSKLRLDEIIDDRQAPMDFANSPHRDLTLKQLKERGLVSEIENRFDGLSRRVFDFLMTRYEAIERA